MIKLDKVTLEMLNALAKKSRMKKEEYVASMIKSMYLNL
jgi:hypothetical protein